MEPCKIRGTTQRLPHAQGLEGKEIFSPSGRGRKMPLTSPLIDQAISLIDPVVGGLSVMGIFRQLTNCLL